MSLAAKLETRVDSSRRGSVRRSLSLAAEVPGSGAGVIIHNLSMTGMLIETSEELATGETLQVEIPERGATPAMIVWNSGRFFGCQFAESIPAASISAALLRNPFSPRPSPLSEAAPEVADDPQVYSLRTRLWIVSGLAAAAWAVIIAAAVAVL